MHTDASLIVSSGMLQGIFTVGIGFVKTYLEVIQVLAIPFKFASETLANGFRIYLMSQPAFGFRAISEALLDVQATLSPRLNGLLS